MARISSSRCFARRNATNNKTVSQKLKESKTAISVIIVVLAGTVGLLYLLEINNVATKGYEIEKYESRTEEIKRENQKMMIELADLKSMYNLESKTKTGQLSALSNEDIVYVVESPGMVAMQK